MRMYPFLYEYPMKSDKDLGAEFLSGKAENAGGLSLAKDDNSLRAYCSEGFSSE